MNRKRWIAMALAAVVGLAVAGGFLLGQDAAPTKADAAKDRKQSFGTAMKTSFAAAFTKARTHGVKSGLKKGRKSGEKEGGAAGSEKGAEKAQDELDLIAAEQARLAAEAEAAERAANCGAPLFVEGYCPTDAEIQQESDAESYCGGGDYETAASLGIEC